MTDRINKDVDGSMTLEEIRLRFERCFEKAEISSYLFSLDPDEDAELFFDECGYFWIEDVRTPYKKGDIANIKYRNYGDSEGDENYVRLQLKNQDHIYFKRYDMYAFILRGNSRLYCRNAKEVLDCLRSLFEGVGEVME